MTIRALASALCIACDPADALATISSARRVSQDVLANAAADVLPNPAELLRDLLLCTKETANPAFLTFGLQFIGRVLELGLAASDPSSLATYVKNRFYDSPKLIPTLEEVFSHATPKGREATIYLLGILLQTSSTGPYRKVATCTPMRGRGIMLPEILQAAGDFLSDNNSNDSSYSRVALLVTERLVTTHDYLCDFSDLIVTDGVLDLLLTIASTTSISKSIVRRLVETCFSLLQLADLYTKASFPIGKEIGIPYVFKSATYRSQAFSSAIGSHTDSIDDIVSILNTRLGEEGASTTKISFIDDSSIEHIQKCTEAFESVVNQYADTGMLQLTSYADFQTLISVLNVLQLSVQHIDSSLARKEYVEAGVIGLCIFLLQVAVSAQPSRSGMFGFTGLIPSDWEECQRCVQDVHTEGERIGVTVAPNDLKAHGLFWPGYRAGLLAIITQLMVSCPAGQEVMRMLDGLPVLIVHCSGDFGCAGAREWALYALKVATDVNPMNREQLSKLVSKL